MNVESIALWAAVIISAANLLFGLWRTYYAKYAKMTYQGSVEYWSSWQERKYDIATQFLKEMGIDSPKEMKKLIRKIEKESKKTRRNKN